MTGTVRSPANEAIQVLSERARTEATYQRDNACRLLRHAVACIDLGKRVVAGRLSPSPESQAMLDEFSQTATDIEAIARRLEGA